MQDKQKAIFDEIVNIDKQFNCLSDQLNVLLFHCNQLVGFRNQISESIEKLIVVTKPSVDNVSVNPVVNVYTDSWRGSA